MPRSAGIILAVALTIATSVAAIAAEPIALRDMGSFHVGGRLVEISGKPVRELTFAPGGVPAKIEQMYIQAWLEGKGLTKKP
jgi:hypothetical protein